MSENMVPNEEARSEKKLLNKHKWRGKLFSAEGKFGRSVQSLENTEEDIASFLATTARPTARFQSAVPITCNDAAQEARRPSIHSPPPDIVDCYRRSKPKQHKGLHVTFAAAAPEVIGEGGEEADLPAMEVSRSYEPSVASVQFNAQEALSGSGVEPLPGFQRRLSNSEAEGLPRLALLQRTPTGLDQNPSANDINDQDRNADESVYPVSPGKISKVQPLYQDHGPHEYMTKRHVQETHRDIPRKSDDIGDHGGRYAEKIGKNGSHSITSTLKAPSPDDLGGNFVDSCPPSQPPNTYEGNVPSGYDLPPKALAVQSPPRDADKESQAEHQADRGHSAAHGLKALYFRSVVEGLGEDSLGDFDSRVRRFNDIFRLGVSAQTDILKVPFVQWIMTATWWFSKGRTELESFVRATDPHERSITTLKQAHVNLAKAWWIVNELTPNHPEVTRFGKSGLSSLIAIIRNFGDRRLAELIEVHMTIISNMRALTMSMKRNGRLPSPELEIQRLNLQILPNGPTVSQDIAKCLINNVFGAPADEGWSVAEPLFPILVGDTERHFSFCRLFVEAKLFSRDGTQQFLHMSCILSVLRERSGWGVKATIASHDGQINLVIQPSGHGGLNWKDVHWKVPSQMIHIDLAENYELRIMLSEKDFRSLWSIYDYTRRVQKDYSPSKSEEIVFERHLDKLHCDDPPNFPSDVIADCSLRLFERKSIATDGTGQCSIHDGYRLTIVTPPGIKTLSSVNYQLGKNTPILFSYQHSRDGPKLVLKMTPSVRLSPSFRNTQDREMFRSVLCGTSIAREDCSSGSLPLRDFIIEDVSADCGPTVPDANVNLKTLHWNRLRITNKGSPPYGHAAPVTVRAEHLRIMVECDVGTLTDRVNLRAGEMQMNLSVTDFNEIKLLRPPQPDMTWSLIDGKLSKEELDSVCQTMQKMATSTTVRTYHFRSLPDLHEFQSMVTGFKVLFDGHTTSFAISRRRKGLPLHKQWEANSARLQVINQDKLFQLVLFLKGFSHGACMNFVLKVTDVFEIFSKSAMFFLRLADAKFAMPKDEEYQTRGFLCLDSPEYPGEHDDITIGFDNEQGMLAYLPTMVMTNAAIARDKFAEALPGPVSKMSRMASLRR